MKDLLPIGSVVTLKGGQKSLMTIGNYQLRKDDKEYDYVAVLFPEGYLNTESFFLFNHEDIEDIKYIGFINSETQMFRQILKESDNEKVEKNGGK